MRTFPLTHNGITYDAAEGIIAQTRLGFRRNRALPGIFVRFPDGTLLDTGDYVLDRKLEGSGTEGTAFGMDYILHVLRTTESSFWEELTGRRLLVLFKAGCTEYLRAYGLAREDGTHPVIFGELRDSWDARGN